MISEHDVAEHTLGQEGGSGAPSLLADRLDRIRSIAA